MTFIYDVIGRYFSFDQTVSLLCASGGRRVLSDHCLPQPQQMDNTLYSCASSTRRAPRCYLDSRRRVRTLSCLFAQGSDMTTGEEIGNITDYLTDSFHWLDLRLELSQSAIREK